MALIPLDMILEGGVVSYIMDKLKIRSRLLLPQVNNATKPTLAFGDGHTGFYLISDVSDNLGISCAGAIAWEISPLTFGGFNTNYPVIRNEVASDINPNIGHYGDADTGLGHAAADQLSLIAGGVEGHRISEAAGAITHELTGTVNNNSAKMAVITTGTYVGDNTVNKAIAHGLAAKPLMVIFTIAGSSWYIANIEDTVIIAITDVATGRYEVTAKDATNFYVGNATEYTRSANATGITYHWVAIG